MKLPKISFKLPKIVIYGIDVIKNFLFFTLYIIITLIAIALIIAPSIKIFKNKQNKYYKVKSEYIQIKKNYEDTLNSLNKLKKKNKVILLKFRRDFNINNFKNFASKYMKIHNIENNKTSIYKNDFIKSNYFIKASIKSPKNFYDFVDKIKDYKNVIRIYFPIDFTKNENYINLTFKIAHYRLKNKNALKAQKSSNKLKEINEKKNLLQ